MNDNKLVSIIVACHNAEPYIDDCINSLVNQTYSNIEIIICDDFSHDKSVEIIQKWMTLDKRIKLIKSRKSIYASGARNQCIQQSRGDFLMIQDIDDVSSLNRVRILKQELERNQEIDFVCSPMKAFSDNPKDCEGILCRGRKYPDKFDFLWGIPFNHPATMFRRECIVKAGGYREDKKLRRCEDYDLFFRLYACGYRGMNLNRPLYYYRQNYENINRRDLKSRIDEVSVRWNGYKALGIPLIGALFLWKPVIGYFVQSIKFCRIQRRGI